MDRIIEEASRIYRQYGSDDMDYVARKLGADVQEVLDTDNIKEVYFGDLKTIVLRPGLPRHERNYLLAHGLGHHLFHGSGMGGHTSALFEERSCGQFERALIETPRSEREADVFAAYLLVPEERLRPVLGQQWLEETDEPVLRLALEFGVPVSLMRERLIFEAIRR